MIENGFANGSIAPCDPLLGSFVIIEAVASILGRAVAAAPSSISTLTSDIGRA